MKQIRTRRDLANNGAPPAFVEPLHVGRKRPALCSLLTPAN